MYQNVYHRLWLWLICLHVSRLKTCLDGLDASKSGRPAVAEPRIRLQQPLLPFNCNKNHEKSFKSKLQWELQTVFIQYPFQSLAALHCALSFFDFFASTHFQGFARVFWRWIKREPALPCARKLSPLMRISMHGRPSMLRPDVYQTPAFEVFNLQTCKCSLNFSKFANLEKFTNFNLSPNFAVQVLVHFWRAWRFACKRCQRCEGLSHARCAAFTESSTAKTESLQIVAKHDIPGKSILIIWCIAMYWRLEPLRYVRPINTCF